jgi:membrane DNA delivery protein
MDNFMTSIVTVATAIIGVAIVAVLVSKNAQTPALIQNATVGFAQDLEAAVSPLSSSGFTGFNALNYANGS